MASHATDEMQPLEFNGLNRKELLRQLERIVSSTHFKNSKRYPSFLRFIVERTVEENTEVLKERNLGTEVFGRPSDYDTNADPIVRVTAGEVRKRIAQYYQTPGHEHELRIDLPLGSYVPHFYPVPSAYPVPGAADNGTQELSTGEIVVAAAISLTPDEELVLPEHAQAVPLPARRRWWKSNLIWRIGLYAMATVGVAAISFFAWTAARARMQNSGTNYFWQSYTSSGNSSGNSLNDGALFVIGVHSIDSTGKSIPARARASSVLNENRNALASMENSDMVPLSDIVSYSKLTDLLTRRSLPYRTKSSVDTTLEELRPGPVVLIGGFNNLWTLRLTSALRFRFVPVGDNVNAIQDSQNPATMWTYDNLQPAIDNSRDYAIVASYYDTTIEQHVVIAAGIGKNGTIAASEFLTTERDMKNWLAEEKLPANKNLELVLETEVLDGQPGPPHVIAFSAW